MATSPDCEQIEKCIKDMIFKNLPGTESLGLSDVNRNLNHNPFSVDDRCLVSNIEKMSELTPTDKLLHQAGTSELIDLNVLTDFAAKHIAESSFGTSKMAFNSKEVKLPHPDLEDDCLVGTRNGERDSGITDLLHSISKNIQNSPNFLSMPENPLPHNTSTYKYTNKKFQKIRSSEIKVVASNKKLIDDVKFPNSKKKRNAQRRLTKEKKVQERMAGLYVQQDLDTDEKTETLKEDSTPTSPSKDVIKSIEKKPVQETSDQVPDIKLKKNIFSALSKEYSFFLQEDGIYRFRCDLCNCSYDMKECILKHLNSKGHRSLKLQNDLDMMLPFLPKPLAEQCEAITDLLTKIVLIDGLSEEDRNIRNNLSSKLQVFVHDRLPTCSVELVGSSASGCGLKCSEVDFVLKVPSEESIPDCLENLYFLMKSEGYGKSHRCIWLNNGRNKRGRPEKSYGKVENDFKKKRPCIKFIDHETSLPCNILIDNGSSLKLGNLLSTYFQLDERAITLGIAVRYWAKLCGIDQQDFGTLPSFCYALFLVHFLQQVQPPVLPVLHEVKEYEGAAEFYSKYLSKNTWKSENTDSVGELWLKFFHYYNFDYKLGENVICIRSSKQGTCKERNWSTRFYAVEDPFLKRNLAYVIPTFQVCHYIEQCFLRTYRYFAYPQLSSGSIRLLKTESFDAFKLSEYIPNKPVLKEDESGESEDSDNGDFDQLTAIQDLEDHDPDVSIADFISTVSNMSLNETKDAEEESDKTLEIQHSETAEVTMENSLTPTKQIERTAKENLTKLPTKCNAQPICYWDLEEYDVMKERFKDPSCVKQLFNYEFRPVTFKGDKPIPLICKLCKESGHQKKNCPNDDLPVPKPLPCMVPEFLEVVTHTLYCIKDKYVVSKAELDHIESDMLTVQSYIREVFPDATLKLFGSFCNGFGFKNQSDMDFCLTFGDRNDGKDLDNTKVIQDIAKELGHHPELINILPITSAKVPIVKFSWKDSGFEGDISLYNTLALVNTELLEAYSKIDARVQVLGYAIKHFAKVLGICDASRGSLSSYAYILMVIFFLQQRNPPVIPVLQELHSGEKPVRLIENWNVWFYRDISKLEEVWPEFGKNTESVGELWLGLLNFYSCDFEWKDYVISIKQKNPLTRFKKLWSTNQLAIEDPFDLGHNLGAGLSRKMNAYILKAFIRARERFGTPVSLDKMKPGNERLYLFNRNFLNSGMEPPQDRGCGNCGKIGHIARNCPHEKTCSYCRRPGHLMKNCPSKKGKGKKTRERDQNQSYNNERTSERRDSNEKHNSRGQNQKLKNDYINRTFPGMQQQQPPSQEGQKLLQMGVPTHRMPPPGFPARSIQNPPPGFNTHNFPTPQVSVNYQPPFSNKHTYGIPPFPRNNKKSEMSPPKHYGSSPPKNFAPKAPFHQPPNPPWPVGRLGFQVERHPVQSVSRNLQHGVLPGSRVERHPNPQSMRNPQPQWQGRTMVQRDHHSMHPKSNQSNNLDHRLNRTNSDSISYNSNHSGRW